MRVNPVCALSLALASAVHAEITLPAVLGDHMVLQRGREIPVWGSAKPDAKVVVELVNDLGHADATATGTVSHDGRFSVRLEALEASSNPRTLRVSCAGEAVERRDVLVGEVWLCGGQSNMEMSVGACTHAEALTRSLPGTVRCITVPRMLAPHPVTDTGVQWMVASPSETGSFTGVGAFFAGALSAELGVPVGLLSINWGGSPIEAWIPADLAEASGRFTEAAQSQRARGEAHEGRSPAQKQRDYEIALRDYQAAIGEYWRVFKGAEPGFSHGWISEPADEAHGWATGSMPIVIGSTDATKPLRDFDGASWWRRTVDVPSSWAGRTARVSLGPIDDSDMMFVNGAEVGRTAQLHQAPRVYEVPAGVLRAGSNEIAMLIVDTGGSGGLSIDPRKMVMQVASDPKIPEADRAGVSLAGAWMWKRGAEFSGTFGPQPPSGEAHPQAQWSSFGSMWNGMMAPAVGFGLRGAIWYQGESNANEASAYRALLPLLIDSWRSKWGEGDFPFGIVQLASFMEPSDDPVQGGWAALRQAQLHTFRTVAHCGLVVTTDVGDAADIHPRNKRAVGERLALWALNDVYDRPREWSGPLFLSATIDGPSMVIAFDHAAGLAARGGAALDGFAIAGADGKFQWASAQIDGERVLVSSPAVAAPRAVRYGWSSNPLRANLVNGAGLPASPFATD
ncbi:MAG: hypothetical protein EXS03_05150 [Phycisphaerales bacterium]|nr:hypothetical protein [Phycisphaerales bacterium]